MPYKKGHYNKKKFPKMYWKKSIIKKVHYKKVLGKKVKKNYFKILCYKKKLLIPALVCQSSSPPTGGHSSPLACGETGVRSRGLAHHHHGLPPPGKWHGGTDPLHAEGGSVHLRECRWAFVRPQRGVRCVSGRGYSTAAVGGTWSAAAP